MGSERRRSTLHFRDGLRLPVSEHACGVFDNQQEMEITNAVSRRVREDLAVR